MLILSPCEDCGLLESWERLLPKQDKNKCTQDTLVSWFGGTCSHFILFGWWKRNMQVAMGSDGYDSMDSLRVLTLQS